MKQIEHISLGLAIASALFIFIILVIHGIDTYLDEPSLFIEPKENKSRTTLNMVLESKNLEGLKKICSLWASQKDIEHYGLDEFSRAIDGMKRDFLIYVLGVSFIFLLGATKIYYSAKKLTAAAKNAL